MKGFARNSSVLTEECNSRRRGMWRRTHTAIRDDPVCEKKLKREEVKARTSPNKDGFAQKKASFLGQGPGSGYCELKSFSIKSFQKDKKCISRPKLNSKQENQFNQQLVPLVRSKARVLPFPVLHTEDLVGAIRQERELQTDMGEE